MNAVRGRKQCPKCAKIKPICEFGADKHAGDGLKVYCRECSSAYGKAWRKANPGKQAACIAKWIENNKERYRESTRKSQPARSRRYRERHPERVAACKKAWRLANPKKVAKHRGESYARHRQVRSLSLKLANVTNGGKCTARLRALLGCSATQFRQWLESNFRDGMAWSNYGLEGWHVDHIIPISFFNQHDKVEQKQCWHYTNMRPLWADENRKKGVKINEQSRFMLPVY